MQDKTTVAAPYLLLAEDDDDLRALLANALKSAGYTVVECEHGMALLERLEAVLNGEKDEGLLAIISDVRMPGVSGLSVLEGLHELGVDIPIFMITAFGSSQFHAKAQQLGAIRTFDKPFDIASLVGDVVASVGLR